MHMKALSLAVHPRATFMFLSDIEGIYVVHRLRTQVLSQGVGPPMDGLDNENYNCQMEKEFILLRSVFKEAYVTDEQMACILFLTKQWYIGVLARIRINAFRIELAGGLYEDLLSSAAASVEAEAAVGNSVYMLPSFYNHDCDPNSHIVWIENADARVKALRDIEADEELRICYIDASMDVDARQTVLSEGFGFRCRCLRCLSGD
ncbi:SET domain protein 38 [Actinidia rufa]|uniref:SET domain protein 38 n=1 Tax=Actinidia rufa TaxID=165716 RepID=A0A7J0FZU2_9ERIC|nr:SET domain protein 38 [Actinidia rufa]